MLKAKGERKMVAKELDVHVSEVTGLIERDDVTGKVRKGNLIKKNDKMNHKM